MVPIRFGIKKINISTDVIKDLEFI